MVFIIVVVADVDAAFSFVAVLRLTKMPTKGGTLVLLEIPKNSVPI